MAGKNALKVNDLRIRFERRDTDQQDRGKKQDRAECQQYLGKAGTSHRF